VTVSLRGLARRVAESVLAWPVPRPAARALVERAGPDGPEYLFVDVDHGDGESFWILPGGGVESGEDPREAAAREVREETGLSVTVGDPVEAFAFETTSGAHVATVFRCADPSGTLTVADNPDDEAITDARWVGADAVGELTTPPELGTTPDRLLD
jgi:8-oxo-dGTP diphosphatase